MPPAAWRKPARENEGWTIPGIFLYVRGENIDPAAWARSDGGEISDIAGVDLVEGYGTVNLPPGFFLEIFVRRGRVPREGKLCPFRALSDVYDENLWRKVGNAENNASSK